MLGQVIGANVGGGQKFRNIMQEPPLEGTVGYVSNFVELFAWMVTMSAYQALWELLYPSVNPYGWGYDFWYDNYARTRVTGHKMGILSSVQVVHEQDLSASGRGRTESATVAEKWQALRNQEGVYLTHFKVNLKKYREKLRLSNATLTGAVTGYLYDISDNHKHNLIEGVTLEFGVEDSSKVSGWGNSKRRKKKRGQAVGIV